MDLHAFKIKEIFNYFPVSYPKHVLVTQKNHLNETVGPFENPKHMPNKILTFSAFKCLSGPETGFI